MRKPKSPPWTEAESETILRLRDVEGRHFDDMAADLPGRTVAAIKLQYYSRLRDRSLVGQGRSRKSGRPRLRLPAVVTDPVPSPPLALTIAPEAVPSHPRRSPAVDAYDAELRARIALQGLTRGLLGDPLPGRSALDARNRRQQGGDGGANG